MAITAGMVKELREMTGAGMMDCKKALSETNGDMDAAVEFLRKNGQAKAEKKAGRIAAEGIVKTVVKDNKAAIVEVNSETDFVAKNDEFQGFVETVPYRGTYVTLLSLDNIKQMIYMRVAVETMVLRDFLKVQNPMTLEEIRHAIAMQKALIQTPGFEPEQFYHMDAELHSIWFGAVRRQKLWDMLQAQQLHYTRFRMLDFTTETDFTRITGEHEEIFRLICEKDEKGLEKALKDHLYFSMKRMRHAIEVDYKDYFEEEPEEGRFVI